MCRVRVPYVSRAVPDVSMVGVFGALFESVYANQDGNSFKMIRCGVNSAAPFARRKPGTTLRERRRLTAKLVSVFFVITFDEADEGALVALGLPFFTFGEPDPELGMQGVDVPAPIVLADIVERRVRKVSPLLLLSARPR